MSYRVVLMPRAIADLDALPGYLNNFVAAHLNRLARAPTAMSRAAVSPPHPPGGMVSESDYQVGDEWHHFAVFFFYGQNETTLNVISIGHSDLKTDE